MKKKWTKILGIVGLVAGIFTPQNQEIGIRVVFFAIPYALFFSLIGLPIDYFTRKKDDENQ